MNAHSASTLNIEDLPSDDEVGQYNLGYRHCLYDLAAMSEPDRATLFESLQATEE